MDDFDSYHDSSNFYKSSKRSYTDHIFDLTSFDLNLTLIINFRLSQG